MRYRTLLLFGAPGVGKGTQGRILGQVPGIVHVACGDVFRSLSPDSELGRTFVRYSSRGELVPDRLTIDVWERHIDSLRRSGAFQPEKDILLLDGIPRSHTQATLLEERIRVEGVLHLVCSNRRALFERIKRRALQEGRFDDANDAIISQRLTVYETETAKTLDLYPQEVIHTVDADRSPLAVLADLADIIHEILAAGVPAKSSVNPA